MKKEAAEYGNWVSAKLVVMPGIVGILSAGGAYFVPALGIVAALLLAVSAYFAYARRMFSSRGRDIQSRMMSLALARLAAPEGAGRVLDIGCGSGALAIRIAKTHPNARVIGVDRWGTGWESSRALCRRNAKLEGVASQVSFENADASSLPYDDASFDAVVSNFVFHEVHRVKDKRQLIEEALRVLKPGGAFVFQDLFLWRRVYGPIDDLKQAVKDWGIREVEFADTSQSSFIPKPLRLPFMLGTAGILHGRK